MADAWLTFGQRQRLRAAGTAALTALALGAAEEVRPAFSEIRKVDVHSHVFEELPGLTAYMRDHNVRLIGAPHPCPVDALPRRIRP